MTESGLTPIQAIGIFIGIPAAIILLVALAVFGPGWWRQRPKRWQADAARQIESLAQAGETDDGSTDRR